MLGIYSFNLGRAAYYNMGMKFLKNFTTKIKNVTGLFYGDTSTTGSVPEFWTWLNNLTNTNKQNVFAYMSKSLITNSSSIPEQWATNMRD